MEKKKISTIVPFYQIPFVQGRQVHSSRHLEIVHLNLEPGGKMDSHSMPMDVLFYVLNGNGILTIGKQQYPMCSNEFIQVPKNTFRFWSNNTQVPLTILVIKLDE